MDMEQALQTFLLESRELLEEMENGLLEADAGPLSADVINAIFRAAHTIKGSSGLFGLDHIVSFTHVMESVLDQVRDGVMAIDAELMSLLLACRDHICLLLDDVEAGAMAPDPERQKQGQPLLARLAAFVASRPADGPLATPVALREAEAEPVERIDGARAGGDHWHISVRFGSEVLRHGMDPMSFIRYLGTLGRIVSIATLHERLASLQEMDPESCYLGFEIAFASAADKPTIEGVFDFVRDDCHLRIIPPHSQVTEYLRLIAEYPDENVRLGEMLAKVGTITERELEEALASQAAASPAQPLGSILVNQGAAAAPVVEAALARQSRTREARSLENSSVRVDAGKLDHLINLVGELIISVASANLIARRAGNAELQECGSVLSHLVEEVRNSALQLRMVKIGATFNRFQRVVHDVARELGKDIELVIEGEETELDKTVVEKITDPLTHLVRNAIDHGIEPAEARSGSGKPARGRIGLNAFHDSGTIVIEVSDDGGGLKRDRILAKAIERGLVEPGRSMADEEIFALIFEPGFSTADQVTNLSGRGVGMDVVKRNINALRGSVEVRSEVGRGTTVTVRLPLTLAIINGFQVGIGRSVFVVPLDMVEECIEFSAEPGHDYSNLRGEVLPLICLRTLFDMERHSLARRSVVVVRYAGQRAGLVVDSLLGESQTVIKPLGKMFQGMACISGASILGSGEVALILDVPALLQAAQPSAVRPRQDIESALPAPA
ncbi:two-component system, chemotaxis family, sensor kinase CheA [Noviherbaspirillum humi]|uniref:Chemotaxis protein CheA n=1 Tax=Noviherbaspirillum humi TaxID=1688639 RepID=A0A239JXV5_9BURK|nr:chemotaxis protein CheA [Noviherbaspirillum humi]SNT10817.1 two-component system, chemotaxis family, sensor kinase CheA [Noviherbaspirillum humi]